MRLGTSYLYAPGRTIDLSFGGGLTPDTPNLQFSVALPFRMGLWGPKPKKLEVSPQLFLREMSGRVSSSKKKGLESCVFEEADLKTDGNDLSEIGWFAEVLTAGTEMGKAKMACAGEFES